MLRSLPAEVRIGPRTHPRREPHPCLAVEHGIVRVGPAVPDRLITPVRRGLQGRPRSYRRVRIANRQGHLAGRVSHRVQDGHVIRAGLERSVDRAVGVDRGIALVGGSLVVEIRRRIGPVPLRDHDVTLFTLWSGRNRRHFAGGDPIGPIREHLQRPRGAQSVEPTHHAAAGLPGLNAPSPGVLGGRELTERCGDLACRLVAQLMTCHATARLQAPDPRGLAPDTRGDAVALRPRPGELALLRHLDQRKPIRGRVVLCGRVWIGRHHRREIVGGSGRGPNFPGIHEPVAPHPDVVGRIR